MLVISRVSLSLNLQLYVLSIFLAAVSKHLENFPHVMIIGGHLYMHQYILPTEERRVLTNVGWFFDFVITSSPVVFFFSFLKIEEMKPWF